MKPIYTVPKLNQSKKDWFVWFRYNGKLKVYKKGLNYIEDEKERLREFEKLRKELHELLKNNWNPLNEQVPTSPSALNIVEAALFALSKKKETLAPRTYESYHSSIKFFVAGIKAANLDYLQIGQVKRIHIKHILAKTKELRNWSNKAYNKNLGYIKAVFGELIQWDIIENSPVYKIKKLKEMETQANTPATDDEAEKIKNTILKKFPNFWPYVVTIFHTGVRCDELLSVRINMVDMVKMTITLPPEITKTDRYRIVPINKHLANVLHELQLYSYPDDYFVFGSTRPKNRGLSNDTDFIPAPQKLNRSTPGTLWRKLVKKGLGIDVNLYSMKHLGANKKILAGLELDTLRELYGHTSKLMTMRYAKIVKEVYRKQIMEHSPDY